MDGNHYGPEKSQFAPNFTGHTSGPREDNDNDNNNNNDNNLNLDGSNNNMVYVINFNYNYNYNYESADDECCVIL